MFLFNKKIFNYFNVLPLILILFACEKTLYVDSMDFVVETEPNEATYNAFEVREGVAYKAKIDKPSGDNFDTDLFKIWEPAGSLITIEFESDDADFMPYIGHTDNLGRLSFSLFETPGKRRSVFVASVNGWQYFEIGDKRNVSDKNEKVGDFQYYFRIISRRICDVADYEKIEQNSTVTREFADFVDVEELSFEETGYYQIDINTRNMISDKFAFVFNCDSGEIVAGNDDEDYYSNLMDPLIYSLLNSNLRNLLVVGKLLSDQSVSEKETMEIAFTKQPQSSELESNDLYNYANVLFSENIDGYLSKEKKTILGEAKEDEDWFKFDLERGRILTFSIKPEESAAFTASIWANSYPYVGSGIIPLRSDTLSGLKESKINMMIPFNGSIFLALSGSDIFYHLEISKQNEILELDSIEGESEIEIGAGDCAWNFYKWKMPDEGDLFEISLLGDGKRVGMHIFSSDYLPFLFLKPDEKLNFFARRYDKTKYLILAPYFEDCQKNLEKKMTLKISKAENNFVEWGRGVTTEPLRVKKNGAYQGFFDTKNNFYENFFELEIEKEGTLYLSTAPDITTTDFDIDTVITLTSNGGETAVSDDMIESINYNKYSYLTRKVSKGEKYTIKINPFMTESSNVAAMNIEGRYILDLQIK